MSKHHYRPIVVEGETYRWLFKNLVLVVRSPDGKGHVFDLSGEPGWTDDDREPDDSAPAMMPSIVADFIRTRILGQPGDQPVANTRPPGR